MEITQRIENWASTHYPAWFDFVRMGLGVFLFVKGFIVLSQIDSVQMFISNINALNGTNVNWNAQLLVQFIAYMHIIGGLFIALGFLTRIAIFFQLPILLGAVLFTMPGMRMDAGNTMAQGGINFVWTEVNLNTTTFEWWTALFTLILLISSFIIGSGPWSVDKYLEHYEET
ncbi:DoxX family protein [Adhaeribacter arboris]|uniref:DoxX family protein n=1 Tax=Adhaeribacter arboris TaxID=2072846 RepID=A0A2T2YBG8_9BACT|nr:DoxX family protein [Adhaeribacter arboris]PSR52871.1 DoxX family protein [Adhaeribacter arboris]